MKAIIPVIIAVIFDYVIHALLVGAAISVIFTKIKRKFNTPLIIFSLVLIFAILDTYWFPAIIPLNLKIIIGNEEVIRLFALPKEMSITDIFEIGILDVVIWIAQSLLSLFVCQRIIGKEKISVG